MLIVFLLLLIYITILNTNIYSQSYYTKQGGVGFEIADNQPIDKLKLLETIFNNYNYSFSFAMNIELARNNNNYIQYIKNLLLEGHEFVDHTPDHCTNYFISDDPTKYSKLDGVDHTNGNKICLKYKKNELLFSQGDGKINVNNNIVVSTTNGAFKNVKSLENSIYIPLINSLVHFNSVSNFNLLDPDTLSGLESFWSEKLFFPNPLKDASYYITDRYNVEMDDSALNLLAENVLLICSQLNIERPLTWVLPGGFWPIPNNAQLSRTYGEKHYLGGISYIEKSKMCYNEFNLQNNKNFGLDIWNLQLESNCFQYYKHILSDNIAKHFVSIGSTHLSPTLGNYNDFLFRLDSLLSWCKRKNIAIYTIGGWVKALYKEISNPYINVFPLLKTDLDDDQLPDGYYYKKNYTDGVFDTADGIESSLHRSFSINKKGSICYIQSLGGLEKGENEFIIYTKGSLGGYIEVTFYFTEYSSLKPLTFKFPAENKEWTKYSVSQSLNGNTHLIIPDSVSIVDIRISCSNYSGGDVKISGIVLYKKPLTSIIPPWGLKLKEKLSNKNVIEWTDNSDNENGFVIERKNIYGRFEDIGHTYSDITTYQDSNLSGESVYRVRAFNDSTISEYTNELTVDDSIVPVELLSLNYELVSNNVRLNWTTLTEMNTSRFNVERNIDGRWDSIGSVAAAGTSAVVQKYSFFDNTISSFNISSVKYRLKEIDLDGSFSYSKELEIFLDLLPKDYCLYKNYPNPFNPKSVIEYDLPEESKVTIEIFDLLGKVVDRRVFN